MWLFTIKDRDNYNEYKGDEGFWMWTEHYLVLSNQITRKMDIKNESERNWSESMSSLENRLIFQ